MNPRQTVPPGAPPVSTMLTPTERLRVDAAGEGSFQTFHRNSVPELVRDIKENRVNAVLVSVTRYDQRVQPSVAAMVREFPRVPTVALLSEVDRATAESVLSLGSSGVRHLIDVRQPNGWRELRETLLASNGDDIQRQALSQLALDLAGVPADCWRFFESLFTVPARLSTVRALARRLDVLPSTLMSRFFRLELPAPKQYLAMARLVRAARLFENSGFSVANVANHLDYSSPQSFGRHVKTLMGITPNQFRQRYDGEGMLDHFRQHLVLPHVRTLRQLRPLSPTFGSAFARGQWS